MLRSKRASGTVITGGFTMVEVLVALSIVVIMSAVLIPGVMNKIRDSRTAALSQSFLGYAQAAAEYKRATTRYPSSLTLLTTAPTATSLDICANQMTAIPASLWRGPYVSRAIPGTGMAIGDAIIPTGLRRVTSGTAIFLLIDGAGVEGQVVDDLERDLDGSPADLTAGTIRAVTTGISGTSTSAAILAPPAGTKNVSYAIPINSC